MSASAVKLADEAPFGFSIAAFLLIMPSFSVGGTTTCCIGTTEKAALVVSTTSEEISQFSPDVFKNLRAAELL